MTQQRTDGAPSAEAATAYLEALRERLAADGCGVTATTWGDHGVVVGSRSDRKARWFGTKVRLFVLAAAAPEVDDASLAESTGWAMDHASDLRGGLPGARNGLMVLPALVGGSIQPSATDWAAKDARILGTTVIGRPVTVQTPTPGAARVTMYRGGVVWAECSRVTSWKRRHCISPDDSHHAWRPAVVQLRQGARRHRRSHDTTARDK